MDKEVMFSSDAKDWETPDWLYDELDREFNFVCDAAANSKNAKCNYFINEQVDSLATNWSSLPLADQGAFWLNPPYGRRISHWTHKAMQEGLAIGGPTVVMLVPARTDTSWWHNHVMAAQEIRLIRGRLRFKGAGASAPFPSAIVVYRPPTVVLEPLKWSVIDARGR